MLKELDAVVLRHDIPEFGLAEGDIGAIVHCYPSDAYEVEFVTSEGKTVAVLTLAPSDIRIMKDKEILHAREIVYH
jgi:hypothetical protein